MKIVEVLSDKDLDLFIRFPFFIYKKDKNWVPPLISEVKNVLTTNPFWEHSDKKLFLLYDNNKIVGRIAGVIDYNYINFQNENAGFFGFFDVLNRKDYANILFKSVEEWLVSKNITTMYGPMNPSTNDEMGFFLEGDEGSPMIMMPYNPFYYHDLVLKYGFEKAKDLYAYLLDYKDFNYKKVTMLKNRLEDKFVDKNVIVRSINLRNIKEEIAFALDVYNDAWEKNWGFVPWTEKEFLSIADTLKSLADPRLILFLEVENKPAGMLIVIPNFNEVFKRIKGKLNLFGLIKFFYYKRKIKYARLMILGIKKEFRKQGFDSLLYLTAAKNAKDTGFEKFEFSWILEDNVLTQKAATTLGAKLYRKYRVYKKIL